MFIQYRHHLLEVAFSCSCCLQKANFCGQFEMQICMARISGIEEVQKELETLGIYDCFAVLW